MDFPKSSVTSLEWIIVLTNSNAVLILSQ
jgi:hypothetical protein